MKTEIIDLAGERIGRLLVKNKGLPADNNEITWECVCDCGNTYICKGSHLRSGRVKSCGCLRKKQCGDRSKKSPFFWLYAILKRNAIRGEKSLELSFQEFLTFTHIDTCHYCSKQIEWYQYDVLIDGRKQSHSYHLDRKDNSLGYTKENCVVCCSLCNYIKGDVLSYSEMLKLGPVISEIQKTRSLNLPLGTILPPLPTTPTTSSALSSSLLPTTDAPPSLSSFLSSPTSITSIK